MSLAPELSPPPDVTGAWQGLGCAGRVGRDLAEGGSHAPWHPQGSRLLVGRAVSLLGTSRLSPAPGDRYLIVLSPDNLQSSPPSAGGWRIAFFLPGKRSPAQKLIFLGASPPRLRNPLRS